MMPVTVNLCEDSRNSHTVLLRRQEPSPAPQALPLAASWTPAFAGERL